MRVLVTGNACSEMEGYQYKGGLPLIALSSYEIKTHTNFRPKLSVGHDLIVASR